VKRLTQIFLILLFSSHLFAQSGDTSKDSLKTIPSFDPLTEMQIKFEDFELHRELYNMKMNVSPEGDSQTIWLRTSILISHSTELQNENPNNLLSPLYSQYLESTKFNPIKYVLGMAQAGAVGYLAYKHIKKYGFFK
jgi:hypothetical protein